MKHIIWSLFNFVLIFFVCVSSQSDNKYETYAIMSSLRNYSIAPDVIDGFPPNVIQIKYANGVEVNLGNELTPLSSNLNPTLIRWPAKSGSTYALSVVDPDANPASAQINHMLIVNIPDSSIHRGQMIADYRGPHPPINTGLHRYIFLVYEQKSRVNVTVEPIIGPSPDRSRFDIRNYAKEHNFGEPIAVNFFTAQYRGDVV